MFSTVRTYLKNIAKIITGYREQIPSAGFCELRSKTNEILFDYLFFYSINDYFVEFLNVLHNGSSFQTVKDNNILKQTISLASIQDQSVIVKEIESRFIMADKVEDEIENKFKRVETLRQRILKKVIVDKLVPQDPIDKPADKLLKMIKNIYQKNEY